MPDVVDSPIHMFADDTKIFRQMTAQSDQVTLQKDLRQLEAWTKKWQMVEKIPPWGRPQMRDLGVQIDHDLKWRW